MIYKKAEALFKSVRKGLLELVGENAWHSTPTRNMDFPLISLEQKQEGERKPYLLSYSP